MATKHPANSKLRVEVTDVRNKDISDSHEEVQCPSNFVLWTVEWEEEKDKLPDYKNTSRGLSCFYSYLMEALSQSLNHLTIRFNMKTEGYYQRSLASLITVLHRRHNKRAIINFIMRWAH